MTGSFRIRRVCLWLWMILWLGLLYTHTVQALLPSNRRAGPRSGGYGLRRRSMPPQNFSRAKALLFVSKEGRKNTSLGESVDDDSDIKQGAIISFLQSRTFLPIFGLAALVLESLLALTGWVPGPASTGGVYTPTAVLQDASVTILAAVAAFGFVKTLTTAAANEWIDSRDSRKLIHTLSAPLYIFLWPLYSAAPGARYFACIVTLMNAIRLVQAGTGKASESSLANAVSRSGDAKEALEGPLVYVGVFFFCILVFWKSLPAGVVAMSALAAGDGMADLIGRRYGANNKWPLNPSKSVAGTVAFGMAASVTAVGLLQWLLWNESFLPTNQLFTTCPTWLPFDLSSVGWKTTVVLICWVSAFLEIVPGTDDNYTVPLSAMLLSTLFLTTTALS